MNTQLQSILRAAAENPDLRLKAVTLAWGSAVGDAISRNTQCISLDGKTLIVATRDQQWKRELGRMSREIIGKLYGALGPGSIDKLVLRPEPWRFPSAPPETRPSKPFRSLAAMNELREASNCIEDVQLRELALRVAVARNAEPSEGKE